MPITRCKGIFSGAIACLILCVKISAAFAGPPHETAPDFQRCIQADEQFQFAGQYFLKGEYDRAAAEYERFIYFFPEDNRVSKARYGIGKSYFQAGEFEKARAAFADLIKAFPGMDLAVRAHVDLSRCYVRLNNSDQAVISLQHLIAVSTDQTVIDMAWYEMGWVFIETANWESAQSSFDRISSKNSTGYEVRSLSEELHKAGDIPKKSPGLAGFFSVMPGGGYLYCGRPKDALTAFLLNSGLIWAAVSAFNNDNPALGAVVGFVETGFYAGNIYGGISSAHKFNKNETQNFIEKLKRQNKINLLMNFETKRVGVLFETGF